MIQLLTTTGQPKIDAILQGLVGLYEAVFPGQIRGYYLTGSFADGSGTGDSDIDLLAVFKGTAESQTLEHFRAITRYAAQISAVLLDSSPTDEASLSRGIKASVKMGTTIYGEAILDQFPLEPLDEHIQRTMFLAFRAIH